MAIDIAEKRTTPEQPIDLDVFRQKLEQFGFSTLPKLSNYLKNLRTNWVGKFLNRDAATDDRLERAAEFSSDVVRPNEDEIDPFSNFSESSWSHKRREFFRKLWNSLQNKVFQVLSDPKHHDHEGVLKDLAPLKEEAFKEFDQQLEIFLTKYGEKYGYTRENIIAAGSGGDAINFLRDLLAGKDAISATTSENGSLVYNILKRKIIDKDGKPKEVKEPQIFLRDEDGNRVPDDKVYQQYEDAITRQENGATFISLTMISKTGLRYDIPDGTAANGETRSVAERVIQFVQQYNAKQQDESKKVKIVLDYIQSVGREDFAVCQQFSDQDGVAASVITTSKGIGAIPHFSLSKLSEFGKVAMAQQLAGHPDQEYWQQTVTNNQIIHADQLEKAQFSNGKVDLKQDVMTALRGADGMNALIDFIDRYIPERQELARAIAAIYDQVFEKLGFKKMPNNTVPQLLAYLIPEFITSETFAEYFTTRCAERGVAWGGALSEKGWTALRGSISNDLIDVFLDPEAGNQDELLAAFKYDLYGEHGEAILEGLNDWIDEQVESLKRPFIEAEGSEKVTEANRILSFFVDLWNPQRAPTAKIEVFGWAVIEAKVMNQLKAYFQ